MFGIYTHDPLVPVAERLRPFPKLKADLQPGDLAALQQMFFGSVHPDPVQAFLDFFSGMDSSSEGEFVMEPAVQEFGVQAQWREMMRAGCQSQVAAWLAALFGSFSLSPPSEASAVSVTVIDDASVNPPEFVEAEIFRRIVTLGRSTPSALSIPITFFINLNPQL